MKKTKHKGLVQVYTGNGKGKTTAALGQALRAVGQGFRTKIFQFMKPPDSSGEHFSVNLLADKLEIIPVGRKKWIHQDGPQEKDKELAREGLEMAKKAMCSGEVDLLVLDEIDVAIYFKMISVEEVVRFIDEKPSNVELILTGRNAAPEIIERADLVTEMRLLKHPYEKGITARKGIEY